MPIMQVPVDIPIDMMSKIIEGTEAITGVVVRNTVGANGGQIIKHLKPVDLQEVDQSLGESSSVFSYIKNHKKAFVVVAVVAGVAGVAAVGRKIYKIKQREPAVVRKYKTLLKKYINALRFGNMNIQIITELIETTEELKKLEDYEKIIIQLPLADLSVIVNEYTVKLANANSVTLTDTEQAELDSGYFDLQKLLYIQKRIFEAVA